MRQGVEMEMCPNHVDIHSKDEKWPLGLEPLSAMCLRWKIVVVRVNAHANIAWQ